MEDILTKGYAVIPNFLTPEEVQIFVNDYKKQRDTITQALNHDVYIADVSYYAANSIHEKINKILSAVNIGIDTIIPKGFYTNTTEGTMAWHQDHGSYYLFQQSYSYLNFYIPIFKPKKELSGLSVVPMDVLEKNAPKHFQKLLNSGAKRFVPENDITEVWDDETGDEWTLPVNIDTIMESPELSAGDLILIRGDVIHKTQDGLTERVAVSIRATKGSALIDKNKIVIGCQMKQDLASEVNKKVISIFEKSNKQMMTACDMINELNLTD